jgi:hypothetical protein
MIFCMLQTCAARHTHKRMKLWIVQMCEQMCTCDDTSKTIACIKLALWCRRCLIACNPWRCALSFMQFFHACLFTPPLRKNTGENVLFIHFALHATWRSISLLSITSQLSSCLLRALIFVNAVTTFLYERVEAFVICIVVSVLSRRLDVGLFER